MCSTGTVGVKLSTSWRTTGCFRQRSPMRRTSSSWRWKRHLDDQYLRFVCTSYLFVGFITQVYNSINPFISVLTQTNHPSRYVSGTSPCVCSLAIAIGVPTSPKDGEALTRAWPRKAASVEGRSLNLVTGFLIHQISQVGWLKPQSHKTKHAKILGDSNISGVIIKPISKGWKVPENITKWSFVLASNLQFSSQPASRVQPIFTL